MGSKLDAMKKAAGGGKPRPGKPPETPKPPADAKPVMKARLPHCSAFAVVYDGTKVEWSGSLFVPGYAMFQGKARGVFGLLAKLDTMYRRAVKKGEVKADDQNPV